MREYQLKTKDAKEIVVYECNGNFHKGNSELPKGVVCASAEELTGIRLLVSKIHQFWTYGAWTAESYNYFPNGEIIIASGNYNPLLRNIEKATETNDAGNEFYLRGKVVDELRNIAKEDVSDAIKSGALLVQKKNVKESFPTKNLADEVVPYFLFRENAKAYGELLVENNIKILPQWVCSEDYIRNQKSFCRALWISGIYSNSVLNGSSNFLSCPNGRVCGIQRNRSIS